MRRMISGASIAKIKALFTSLWADADGNVEVGKNLHVDGNGQVNGNLIVGDGYGLYYNPSFDMLVLGDMSGDGQSITINGFYYDCASDDTGIASNASYDSNGWTDNSSHASLSDLLNDKYYRHHLTIKTTTKTTYQDYESKSNLVIDSLQDLSTITGNHPFGNGVNIVSSSNVWKMDGEAITSISDDVQLITD